MILMNTEISTPLVLVPCKVSVYVAASFEPLRTGLARAIERDPDMRLIGEAASLAVGSSNIYRQADVLLMDVQTFRSASTQVAVSKLNEWLPELNLLLVGDYGDARLIDLDDVEKALPFHTVGFLLNSPSINQVVQAVRLVATGVSVCEMGLFKRIYTGLSQSAFLCVKEKDSQLSEWERELLSAAIKSHSAKEIARTLGLSERIAEASIIHIMEKLNSQNKLELVRHVLDSGLASFEGN